MADEQFKPLGKPGILGAALGQGRDIHRVHGDEGRLDELLLHLLVKALIQGVAPGGLLALRQDHARCLGGSPGGFVVRDGHEVDAHILLDRLCHGHPGPAGGQIDLLALPLHLIGAQDLLGSGGEQLLKEVHHIVEIRIGLVELHGGELRVVLGVHALVAENPADLIHPVQSAHDQPLEGQLRGDAHIHVDVQGIMVGDEGTGSGTTGDGVKHRRLHFHIAPVIQEIPDMLDELGTDDEVLLYLGVDDQIHIALTIPQFPVLQAVELLRQGQQRLGKQNDVPSPDAHLAPLRTEHFALYPDNVTNVVLLEGLVDRLIHLVLTGVELDATVPVLEVTETHLAHAPLAHQAASHLDRLALQSIKVLLDLGRGMVPGKPGDLEGVMPLSLKGGQLFPADSGLLAQVLLALLGCLLFSHRLSPYRSIFLTVYSMLPRGASTVTVSPSLAPSRALPKGDSSEMTPCMGSASWEPTIR